MKENTIGRYIDQLRTQNGYCECPPLQPLLQLRRSAQGLEGRCDMMRNNIDLDEPKGEDRQFLQDFERAVADFQASSETYHQAIDQGAKEGRVSLILHDKIKLEPKGPISYDKMQPLIVNDDKPLITIHCSSCEQQIDLLSVS